MVNLDHLQKVRKDDLTGYLGRLDDEKLREGCRAVATGCGA